MERGNILNYTCWEFSRTDYFNSQIQVAQITQIQTKTSLYKHKQTRWEGKQKCVKGPRLQKRDGFQRDGGHIEQSGIKNEPPKTCGANELTWKKKSVVIVRRNKKYTVAADEEMHTGS